MVKQKKTKRPRDGWRSTIEKMVGRPKRIKKVRKGNVPTARKLNEVTDKTAELMQRLQRLQTPQPLSERYVPTRPEHQMEYLTLCREEMEALKRMVKREMLDVTNGAQPTQSLAAEARELSLGQQASPNYLLIPIGSKMDQQIRLLTNIIGLLTKLVTNQPL